jgi:predicted nuclease of restriction endonuclease-like (RecB) superfamily
MRRILLSLMFTLYWYTYTATSQWNDKREQQVCASDIARNTVKNIIRKTKNLKSISVVPLSTACVPNDHCIDDEYLIIWSEEK